MRPVYHILFRGLSDKQQSAINKCFFVNNGSEKRVISFLTLAKIMGNTEIVHIIEARR